MRSRVSVITLTYNHERYIERCIGSVFSQSYGDWEMIVIDDGSTDRTGEIIRSYDDRRIRYIRNPHRGIHALAAAYNEALEMAGGELIAILEGDDFWPEAKLARQVPAFADPGVVLSYGIARIVRADGMPMPHTIPSRWALRILPPEALRNTPVGSAVRWMLIPDPGVFTYPCTLLLRRSALEELGGFRTVADRHAVDWATCLHLALRGRFTFIPEVTGFWRRHAASVNSSLRLEGHLKEDYRYVRAFAEAHRERLGLSQADFREIDLAWDRLWSSLWRMQGRQFLLQRDWQQARQRFLRTFATPDTLKGRLASAAGVLASVGHRDIEWVWQLRDRPTLIDET